MALSLSARVPKEEIVNEYSTSVAGTTFELGSTSINRKVDCDLVAKGKIIQFVKSTEGNEHYKMFLIKRGNFSLNGSFGHIIGNQVTPMGSVNFSNREQSLLVPSQISQRDDNKVAPRAGMPHMILSMPSLYNEGRDQSRTLSSFQQVQKFHNLLPKVPKSCQPSASEASKEVSSYLRVARPSGEGRGRNQLLPLYWPRITDQEQQ